MRAFLTMKHWQLFILLFAIPVIIQMVVMGIVLVSRDLGMMQIIVPIIMVLYIAGFFGWLYTVATNLNQRLPASLNMPLNRFRIFMIIPVLYILFISFFLFGKMGDPAFIQEDPSRLAATLLMIVPIHLFSMFCIFYCIWFVAKSLKAVELQRRVSFSDYIGEFFLFWFFVVGVWLLQPRINKMFANAPQADAI
jgi:hypothetical protein